MTSLPAKAPQNVQGLTDVVEAYSICFQIQLFLQQVINFIGKNIGSNMIYIWILVHLIHYSETGEQSGMVAQQIISANNHVSLLQIGQSYWVIMSGCVHLWAYPLYYLMVTHSVESWMSGLQLGCILLPTKSNQAPGFRNNGWMDFNSFWWMSR